MRKYPMEIFPIGKIVARGKIMTFTKYNNTIHAILRIIKSDELKQIDMNHPLPSTLAPCAK